VLDEPTNDLDLETLDLLQEVIADYDGTVLIVSHDRDFLDRTVTVTLGSTDRARSMSSPAAMPIGIAKRDPRKAAKAERKAEGRLPRPSRTGVGEAEL
jgi:ATP-binding cassette subfamily F protein uup